MKKLFILLSLALLAAGCESVDDFDLDANTPRSNSIIAKIESIANDNSTRAHLEDLKVLLDDEDKIAIFDNNTAKSEYTFSAQTSEFYGTSLTTGEGLNGVYALYPASACVSCSAEQIAGSLPATQIYKANSFATTSHIMYAKCDELGDEIELKNMVSYIRLHLYAAAGESVVVKKITLETNNAEIIAGDFHIDNTADTPELIMGEGGSSSVTLDCSAEEGGGVKLSNSKQEPTIFYIAMPVQKYEEGFTVTITDSAGGEFTKRATTPIDLKRNIIKPMENLETYSMINTFTIDTTVENKEYHFGNLDNSFEYGITKQVYATDVENLGFDGMKANIHTPKGEFDVHISIPGEHNVYNALCATAVGLELGLSLDMIKSGIEKAKTIAGRTNFIKANGMTIIDDCYNANPVSMKTSLEILSHARGRHIAVLGDMGELGNDEEALHYEVGEAVGQYGINTLFCAGKLAANYAKAAKSVNPECDIHYYVERDDMLGELKTYVKHGDSILVKASHFMEFTEVVNALSK